MFHVRHEKLQPQWRIEKLYQHENLTAFSFMKHWHLPALTSEIHLDLSQKQDYRKDHHMECN